MPCPNPRHCHSWTDTFTPLKPTPNTKFRSKSSIRDPNGRLVITLERCECMCGFCPENKRKIFRITAEVVRHVELAHPEQRAEGTIVRARPSEYHARRPGAKGVSMRDSDKKYEWRGNSWERRDQGVDEEDEDEIDALSKRLQMDDDEGYDGGDEDSEGDKSEKDVLKVLTEAHQKGAQKEPKGTA